MKSYSNLVHNIKEISILSNYTLQSKPNEKIQELLRMSNGWISFKKSINNEVIGEWSFKNTISNYYIHLEPIEEAFEHLLGINNHYDDSNSNSKFNIRIILKNDEKIDITCNGDFYSNNMIQQAKSFLRIIPSGIKEIPYVLAPFRDHKLNKNTLEHLRIENICALMYAEGGAMGCPGIVELVDNRMNLYTAKTLYDEECDITQVDVTSLFKGFQHIDGYASPDISWTILNDENWLYLNLGAGNHLYINEDMCSLFANKIFDISQPSRYRKWCDLIRLN